MVELKKEELLNLQLSISSLLSIHDIIDQKMYLKVGLLQRLYKNED